MWAITVTCWASTADSRSTAFFEPGRSNPDDHALAGPQSKAGGGSLDLVEMVDVMPTVLHLMHLPVPPDLQGLDLVPLLEGSNPVPERMTWSSASIWKTKRRWSARPGTSSSSARAAACARMATRPPNPGVYPVHMSGSTT